MLEAHKKLAQEVVEMARSHGADKVSVSLGDATAFQVEIRQQQIDLLKEAGSSGIEISLNKDQRRSSISSNDLRVESLEALIESTIQTLPYMDADEHYALPEPSQQGRAEVTLDFMDPQFEEHTSQEKISNTLEVERTTLSRDERLQTEQAYYSDVISHSVYADSNGFVDGYSKTFYAIGMSAVADDQADQGENVARKQNDGWYTCSRHYKQLKSLDVVADKASQRILRKLGATKPKSQEVPVVFSPEMAASFFGNLASAMMGDLIYRKQSFLRERLNTEIARSTIQLYDNPLLPDKLGSRYFDSEGVTAKPLSLIENGVLKNYMLSTYSANKLNMTTTGHSGGISNLILEPGPYSEQELIESIDNGLYLTSMFGQGVNLATGDYSRGGQGLWIRNGKLAEPVSEFTIASTFFDMLHNLSMISNETDERSSILVPAFKIDSMAISGV